MLLVAIVAFAHVNPIHLRGGRHASTTFQWVIVCLALWSAISGFTFQRRLLKRGASLRRPREGTLFNRWKAANLLRISSAVSVGLYGLLLHLLGGPIIWSDVLFGISLLLLLFWKPGAAPPQSN